MSLDQVLFTARDVLLAVALGTMVYLLESLLFARRRQRRAEARLDDLEAELVELQARLDALESLPRGAGGTDSISDVHAEAARLAQAGLAAAEVAQRSGISLTEAELIVALRRPVP